MKKLNKKNGFLLIGSFATVIVLSILSAAIFAKSINENLIARENMGKLSAKYNAEKGLECAYFELVNNGPTWRTHYYDPDDPYDPTFLYNLGSSLNIFLDEIAEQDATTGEYKAKDGKFFTKVYLDQGDNQFVILSRGISDTTDNTCLLATKISISTLYGNFWFSPYDMYMGWTTYHANGGDIHTNGDIRLSDSVVIQDINLLEAAGYIRYNTFAYMPPEDIVYDIHGDVIEGASWNDILYNMREPWPGWVSHNFPEGQEQYNYYHSQEGRVYGERNGLYMHNPDFNQEQPAGQDNPLYVTCEGDFANCVLPEENPVITSGDNEINPDLYMFNDYHWDGVPSGRYHYSTLINAQGHAPERIPTRLNSNYDWDLFEKTSGGYWWEGVKNYYPDPTGNPVTIENNFLNTYYQSSAWQDWLPSSLQDVIREHNSGAEYITPARINSTTYFNQAQSDGMYITQTEDCGTKAISIQVYVEGEDEPYTICPDADGTYRDPAGGKIIAYNHSFIDANSWQLKDNVIALNVNVMTGYGTWPENGIIYSDYDVALTNANNLLAPLTTVSKENIYLLGDYNTGDAHHDWQPSAIIAAKRSYTLSATFFDEMDRIAGIAEDELPYTIHNPDYPYVQDEDWHEGNWTMLYDDRIVPIAGGDDDGKVEYNVSIVGYKAYPPGVMERWWESGYQKIVTGAFVNLENDNFEWNGFYQGSGWPIFDWNRSRTCNSDFSSAYPESPCRNPDYPGWNWDMTYQGPGGGNNIFQFETRYTPDTLPPGELPGYFTSIKISLIDNEYNFSHHPAEFNTAGE